MSSYANLLQILRRANAHYSHIASIIRASIHPSHHARKRAAALRLTVSIQKALNLDPKQISTIPPPVLDRIITPPVLDRIITPPVLDRIITPPMHLTNAVMDRKRERELARAKCTIPSFASGYSCMSFTPDSPAEAHWDQNLTSRWSTTTIDADSDVAQELPESVAITYSPDILSSPTQDDQSVWFRVKPIIPQLNLLPPYVNNSNKISRHLDIPVDVTRPSSWSSDISSSRSFSTGSASTSSRGPVTPEDNADETEKFMIRIKRKSAEINNDMLEKRPKYERKKRTISHRKFIPRTTFLHPGPF